MRDGNAIVRGLGGRRESRGWAFPCPCHVTNHNSAIIFDSGVLYCHAGCAPSDIAAKLDVDFPDDGRITKVDPKAIARDRAQKIAAAKAKWNYALYQPDYVGANLKQRGITLPVPPVLRRWRNGFIAALQSRTYEITAVQGKSPTREENTGAMTGSAVKLHAPCDGELGLAESVFDALTAYQLFDVPTWATCGSSLFHQVDLPVGLRLLHLFPDNDDAGRKAVERAKLAYRVRMKIHWPPPDFKDWNDALRGKKR